MNLRNYKSVWSGGRLNRHKRLRNQIRYFEENDTLYLEVQLNHDRVMLCDLIDRDLLESRIWYCNKNTCVDNKGTRFHRLINPKWKIVGHINDDGLDNRRFNLREQNEKNYKLRKDNKSGVKGLCYHKKDRRWGYHWFEGKDRKSKYFYGARGDKRIKTQVVEFKRQIEANKIKNRVDRIAICEDSSQCEIIQEMDQSIEDQANDIKHDVHLFHENIYNFYEQDIEWADVSNQFDENDIEDAEYYKLCDEYLDYTKCSDDSVVAIVKDLEISSLNS